MNKARILHNIRTLALLLLLLLGGMGSEAWAYKVTYHILTLPINASWPGVTNTDYYTWSMEAVRTIVDDASTVGDLPAHFKSPLAKEFKFYQASDIDLYSSGTVQSIYANHSATKYILYKIKGGATPLSEGAAVTADCDIYVTYEYNAANTIAKLDGSEAYNIVINNGFLAYNMGRNNRLAVVPEQNGSQRRVSGEQAVSHDFIKVDVSGANIGTYWADAQNKNPRSKTESKFYFKFKLEGSDPYNITIRTAYDTDDYYIEKYASCDDNFVNKYYKESSLFAKSTDEFLFASDDNKKYKVGYNTSPLPADPADSDPMPGYYRNLGGAIWNSFALLNNTDGTGLVFMGSRLVDGNGKISDPTKKNGAYQYYYFQADPNKMYYKLMSSAEATNNYTVDPKMHKLKTYIYKVKTPFGNILTAEKEWTEAYGSDKMEDHVPDALKRKYVTFTGTYQDEDLTLPLADFDDADDKVTADGAGKRVVWLKYESNMPFESLPVGGSYEDARWYTIRMNGSVNQQYLGYYYYSSGSFYSGLGSTSNLHQGEASAKAQFAFIGDPFELKIISRAASEADDANRYVGCAKAAANGTTLTPQTGSVTAGVPDDISTWQIEWGEIKNPDYMVLQQFNTEGNFIGWNSEAENKPMTYSTTSTTIRVVELEKKDYVFHIVRPDGSIAVKATDAQDVGTPLKKKNIPSIIYSPFLDPSGVTVTFYSDSACTDPITHAPYTVTDVSKHIYVKYNMNDAAAAYLNNKNFYVQVNGEFIYNDGGTIKSKESMDVADAANGAFIWKLGGNDPYAMTIQNTADDKYVEVADWATGTITNPWPSSAPDSKYIVKLSPYTTAITNSYEVMAATGDDVDAATTYYNMARLDNTTVKMVSNTTTPHGSPSLRFQLIPTTSHNVTYHLIDKEGVDLLQVVARHADDDDPDFPAQYRSPLVSHYHYYELGDFTRTVINGKTHYALDGTPSELDKIESETTDVYVLYNGINDVSDKYDLQTKKTTYLLKYETGTDFRAENGSDDLEPTPIRPIYPYCNGDCNFFVYGQAQFDLQQEGASSTRTRWAWYLESANGDPYHVKICSRQQETANEDDPENKDIRGYFKTYQPDDYDKVITALVWPNVSGLQGTEYMILGTTGRFRLVTTNAIPLDADHDETPESTQRYTVTSFENYWKTFDTIKKKLLKDILEDKDKGNSKFEDANGSITVPHEPASYRELLTGTDPGEYALHSYKKWAYAKRFNGYNKKGKTSKGWEEQEHWFQTVEMGEGVFDLIPIDINPVLILLDQHGWEIMRKPLPTSPDDPTKAAKYDQIRPYDSPMVKEYYFWTKASKRIGFHQYYNLSQQVMNDGKPYTSHSLTDLPPYSTATNLRDAKGNQYDEYVTYTVKDEYAQSYNSATKAGQPFLIQQGSKYASYDGSALSTLSVPSPGGMPKYIIDNIANLAPDKTKKTDLWYVKPNARIDYEMGYVDKDADLAIETNHDWTDETGYTGYTGSFSDGFDPYNIQISSVPYDTKYFVTNATGATLEEGAGSLVGTYDADPAVSMGAPKTDVSGVWYDSRVLPITNATFMAVQDADGNMQLMPRFDQTRRMKDFTELTSNSEDGHTYTQLFRPLVYNYHIIDNQGRESLRYKSGGDLVPQTPDHFKSPLAKDFTYYKGLTLSEGVYTEVKDKQDISSKEITASFASASLTASGSAGNEVYVRYTYDKEADELGILQGKWLTMQLNEKDAKYDGGIKEGTDKPEPVDGDDKAWQWKFLKTPQSDPDPYAVQLFNRNNPGADNELPTSGKRFALLSHTTDDYYALAEAGTANADYDTYNFLNGNGAMSTFDSAPIYQETGFLSTSCSFSGTNSQLLLIDEVEHTYTYKIYTNTGAFAISETQDNATVVENGYVPVLPSNIQTLLLNIDQFRYYNKDDVTFGTGTPVPIAATDTLGKALTNLYGLYDDEVIVHYVPYDPLVTTYKVPNVRNTPCTTVAKGNGSNDASIDLSNELLYNIIWYDDDIMTSTDDETIIGGGSHGLMADNAHEWKLDGNDPYAIKLRHKNSSPTGKCVYNSSSNDCTLSDNNATTFMLLPKSGYDYGVLQVTGDANARKLTGVGSTLTTDAVTDPTPFVIFLLSTHKVTYHLVIATLNTTVTIPYRPADESGNPYTNQEKTITGTTQRNLVANPIADVNVGQISLGDQLKVPDAMFRPNVDYEFYVQDIYDVYQSGDVLDGKEVGDDKAVNGDLNNKYKGLKVTAMGKDEALLGKHVIINIHYVFKGNLKTNSGNDFVKSVSENKWYTFEAQKADGTPQLMQFTNAWGMEVKEGRGTHYTNDYLWTPIGDPYGFKMYHRYTYVNSGAWNNGEPHRVMTTSGTFSGETIPVTMGYDNDVDDDNSVYELLEAKTPGFFKIHPVANSGGTQYYFKIVNALEPGSSTVYHDYVRLTSDAENYTEFTFGLSEDMVKPYYDRAGYVGGLTAAGKALYEAAGNDLMAKQDVVYNPANIVPFTYGYYRLHSPSDISGIATRYASGYTHKTELDYDGSSADANGDENNNYDPLPMHFYERKGISTNTFEMLGINTSPATRGVIPISEPVYDPASIFRFEQVPWRESQGDPAGYYQDVSNMAVLSTQGLYVKGSKGPGNTETSENGKAIMIAPAGSTPTSSEATPLFIMDIGGGIMLIHDQQTASGRANLKYLSFDQSSDIYDLKLTHNTHTDHAKWLIEPVKEQGLKLTTNSDGKRYYYTTFCAPYDVTITTEAAEAFVDKEGEWDNQIIHLRRIGKTIPAGTPAIIRSTAIGDVSLTVPGTRSSSISSVFSGKYLEQLLEPSPAPDVYVLGLPFTSASNMTPDAYFETTGEINGSLFTQTTTGVGFYLNATPNKEADIAKAGWTHNNLYVLHNKIYYRAGTASVSYAPRRTASGIEYIPVVFEDDEIEEPQLSDEEQPVYDGSDRVYDMQGRCVMMGQPVIDGSWRYRLPPGIYILNGKKIKL